MCFRIALATTVRCIITPRMIRWLRHGLRRKFIDSPRLRCRRILLPAMAFLLAGGRQGAIDPCYIASNLLFLFFGAWWLARYFVLSGLSPAWSILFVTTPAAVTSLDRLTVDLSLTALAMGFRLLRKNRIALEALRGAGARGVEPGDGAGTDRCLLSLRIGAPSIGTSCIVPGPPHCPLGSGISTSICTRKDNF